METSMHRELKERYGPGSGGRTEVPLDGYRIDAVAGDGVLIEIQSGALRPLRKKLERLLPDSSMRIVKPVVVARRVVRRARKNGPDLSARFSPKRGSSFDVFDDLIGLAKVFPHPNLEIEVLAVEIDEVRMARTHRSGFIVLDRMLRTVVGSVRLRVAGDLWELLPDPENWRRPFTTRELADRLQRPLHFAQRVAYCLNQAGASRTIGKRGNLQLHCHCATSDPTEDRGSTLPAKVIQRSANRNERA